MSNILINYRRRLQITTINREERGAKKAKQKSLFSFTNHRLATNNYVHADAIRCEIICFLIRTRKKQTPTIIKTIKRTI